MLCNSLTACNLWRASLLFFVSTLTGKKRRAWYVVDRLKPPAYAGNCNVSVVRLFTLWQQACAKAEAVLQHHLGIGDEAVGIFEEFFSKGVTLLKPNVVPLHQNVDYSRPTVDSWLGQTRQRTCGVPDSATQDNENQDVPTMDSFLATREGEERSTVYIRFQTMTVVHNSQLVNTLFNEYCE